MDWGKIWSDMLSMEPGIVEICLRLGCAMLVGLVIVPIISLFTPSPDKALVDSAFACYEKETTVAQKTALGK